MPKGLRGEKRPADVIGAAVMVGKIATGEIGDQRSASRENLLKGIEASDTFAHMQAKIIRETILKTAAAGVGTTGAGMARRGRSTAQA